MEKEGKATSGRVCSLPISLASKGEKGRIRPWHLPAALVSSYFQGKPGMKNMAFTRPFSEGGVCFRAVEDPRPLSLRLTSRRKKGGR